MELTDKYKTYILLEQGLSDNTREAYMHDVEKLIDFLQQEGIDILNVKLDDLHRFTEALPDVGITARSINRILSGVRSFYHFLLLEGYLEADPTQLLESPKVGAHLPTVLSIEEVDALLAVIDQSSRPRHHRNTLQLWFARVRVVLSHAFRPLSRRGFYPHYG